MTLQWNPVASELRKFVGVLATRTAFIPRNLCFLQTGIAVHAEPEYARGDMFGDNVLATAILARLLHHSTTLNMLPVKGETQSWSADQKRNATQ